MESGTGCDNVRVVRRRHIGDCSGAASVEVTQLVAEILKFIRRELVVIIEHIVVSRARGAEEAGVTLKVKVELNRMNDFLINHGPGQAVAGAVTFLASRREEARVVSLLHDDKGNRRLVPSLELLAGCLQVGHLSLENLRELTLRDPVAIEKDSLWLATAAIKSESNVTRRD